MRDIRWNKISLAEFRSLACLTAEEDAVLTDSGTSELFYKLSEEEMDHMRRLRKATERLIEGYRRQKGEPPEAMMAVYNHLHQRAICKAERVGVLQNMYNK